MNDKYPRMKNFFYWYRPNIILSITIYEYVFNMHCNKQCRLLTECAVLNLV